ncbi:Na+/H+ antiporter [Lentilactobacillus kosonis]|uniref:Na+/H+ antiporter n=1 Tax=Lentilactobacillus kosonis TaxID=2810561 RepID=A0A401FHT4_9LACO|nr:Na+/H+ antiporter [Lentilactobacillus kosonis]
MGLLLGWLIVMTRLWMIRGRLSGPQVVIPYNILTPFIIYFIAELFGVSGILAVVAAGMVHGWQSDLLKLSSSRLQITTNSAWELLSSVLNGVVFVLLGISFPEVLNELRDHSVHNLNLLIFVGISLYIVMVLVRFLWVWFGLVKLPHEDNQSKLKDSMLIAINGIHGTITMAMAFSLPLSLNRNFNYGRADLIFISAIVIGLSLLVPAVVLKLILPAKKPSYTETELDEAKGNAINAGIDRIRHYPDSQNLKAVIQILNSQRYLAPVMDEKRVKSLLDEAKQIEQATITAMVKDNKISDSEAAQYKQMAIVMYDRYSRNIWIDYWNWIIPFSKLNRESRKLNRELKRQVRGGNKLSKAQLQAERHQWIIKMNQVQREPYEAITNYLDNLPNPFERPEIMLVRAFYDQRQRFWNRTSEEQTAQNEMLTIAFQEEYSYVQNLINNGDISSQLGNKVFDEIANDQILYMQRNDRDS